MNDVGLSKVIFPFPISIGKARAFAYGFHRVMSPRHPCKTLARMTKSTSIGSVLSPVTHQRLEAVRWPGLRCRKGRCRYRRNPHRPFRSGRRHESTHTHGVTRIANPACYAWRRGGSRGRIQRQGGTAKRKRVGRGNCPWRISDEALIGFQGAFLRSPLLHCISLADRKPFSAPRLWQRKYPVKSE